VYNHHYDCTGNKSHYLKMWKWLANFYKHCARYGATVGVEPYAVTERQAPMDALISESSYREWEWEPCWTGYPPCPRPPYRYANGTYHFTRNHYAVRSRVRNNRFVVKGKIIVHCMGLENHTLSPTLSPTTFNPTLSYTLVPTGVPTLGTLSPSSSVSPTNSMSPITATPSVLRTLRPTSEPTETPTLCTNPVVEGFSDGGHLTLRLTTMSVVIAISFLVGALIASCAFAISSVLAKRRSRRRVRQNVELVMI
jgi:hypothetical protein